MLSGPAKGTQHSHPGTPDIRFITRDVAIVDGDSYMAGFRDEQGKELHGEYSRYTAVFVKKNGKWYVTAFRSPQGISPDGVIEAGLRVCPAEKKARKLACRAESATFSGPV
jgi:Calcium/calmodulin dependent protein kinase II association domain